MKQQHFIYLAISILLTACDPARMLFIENKTEETIEVTIHTGECKGYIVNEGDEEMLKNIVITADSNNIQDLYLGMGKWRDEDFDNFKDCVTSISVVQNGQEEVYEGEALQKMIVGKNIGKFTNSQVTIVISD